MKSGFFNKTLCTLLTTGFIFWGCNSLNKYESDLSSVEKSAIMQTETPVKQDSHINLVRSPMNIEKPNLYFSPIIQIKENVFLGYKKLLSSKQDYAFDNKQPKTNSQAREKLYEHFGLNKLRILPNKINFYKNSFFDARIRFKFLKIEEILNSSPEERQLGPLKSAELTINLRF